MALVIPGRLVFIHVPKTAGTWVKQVLRPQIGGVIYTRTNHGNPWAKAGHPDLEDLRDIDGFRMAFVRHPVDWWLSFFRHRMRRGSWNLELELDRSIMTKSIDRYIENILKNQRGFASRMFAEFVGEPGSEIDFIGKQENFGADLRRGLSLAGFDVNALDLSAGRKNSGGKKTAHYRFSADQQRRLSEAEQQGIERFGYEPWH